MMGMQTRFTFRRSQLIAFLYLLNICLIVRAQANPTPTTITVGTTIQRSGLKRLGINLGGQAYWDSRQLMNNLVYRNPGFETETWQTIFHCKAVTATTCTDDNTNTIWWSNFIRHASVEFIGGSSVGKTGTIAATTAAVPGSKGVTLTFTTALNPAVGDYLVARLPIDEGVYAGWWVAATGSGTITGETTDISPNSPGKQAIELSAPTTSTATLNSYFDTTAGRSFIQLSGTYTLTFRAKLISGAAPLNVQVLRLGNAPFLNVKPALTTSWQDLSYTFSANEVNALGNLAVMFKVASGTVLLDDVTLTKPTAPDNPTVFRDEVVDALRTLNPGVIRYMDDGTDWGSSLDNMLTPPLARLRAGYSNYSTEMDDIPIGLHEFMVLCQAVNAEPWYTLPAGMSVTEMSNLMDYLGSGTSTVYGARRAALGQAAPWTTVFPTIHLEFGNEVWNTANPGATFTDPVAYGKRAGLIFGAGKASASYSPTSFDFIVDGWEANTTWTKSVLAASSNYNTVDQSAYFFGPFTNDASSEVEFGSMFAGLEQTNSTSSGVIAQRVKEANSAALPAKTAIYEANIGTVAGTVSPKSVNQVIPSLGAGLANVDNLLLLMRDQGIIYMNMFEIAQDHLTYVDTAAGGTNGTTPIFGITVDMGGPTNRKRPSYLAEALANQAIRPNMLTTTQTGFNPTWNQAAMNGALAISTAHYIQSFAFTDGTTNSLILFNLSRSTALPILLAGPNAPSGDVAVSTLTSSSITDSNESAENVKVTSSTIRGLNLSTVVTLPPYSMTVLTTASPTISGVAVTCDVATVSVGGTTTCSSTVTGTGTFNANVNWSSSAGTISASGLYTAPASVPATGVATIKATSLQDSTKSGIATLAINNPNLITVICSPTALTVGSTAACAATINSGATPNVGWSASIGTITSTGVYTAPSTISTQTKATITATSLQDASLWASTTVVINPAGSVIGVVVNCTPSSIATSSTASCVAAVSGTGSFNTGVTWKASVGTISSAGLYTAPPTVPSGGAATITATSIQDPTKTAVATIIITLPGVVTKVVAMCPASAAANATVSCTSTVTGTGNIDPTVIWATTGGTIDQNGNLISPSTLGPITVTATSRVASTKTCSVPVNISGTPILSSITISSLTPTSLTISWQTNGSTSNGVDWGTTKSYGLTTPWTSLTTSTPSFTLTGLSPETLYYIMAYSKAGTTSYSTLTVMTPAQ